MYHIDYETRSKAELKKVGAYRYACDPSTRILMFAIAQDDGEPMLWYNPELFQHDNRAALALLDAALADPAALLWAHNAEFERAVSRYRMKLDIGRTPPPTERWRCTAALARKAGLRPSLANIGEDLNLGQKKWGEGYQLIRMFSIPQKDTGEFIDPKDEPEKFAKFGFYCQLDVKSEREVHQRLKPFELKTGALDTFLFDARMNDRGLPLNIKALQHAQKIIESVQTQVAAEFKALTGLEVTQRDKVKAYLVGLGLKLANMQSKTTDDVITYHEDEEDEDDTLELPENPTEKAIAALRLYKLVSYAAIKKVKTMLDCACPDGFARGMFLYYGAGTGRWSGQKIQPQNFKKPTIKDAAGVYKMLCARCSEQDIEELYGNPLEAIANCIRNFIHDPTAPMFDADYSSVEARIICWLAGQEDALERFRKGVDSYILMASMIYDKPQSQIRNPSSERDLGKRAILGCGFGMGPDKFKKTAKVQGGLDISDDLSERAGHRVSQASSPCGCGMVGVRRCGAQVDPQSRTRVRSSAVEVRSPVRLRFAVSPDDATIGPRGSLPTPPAGGFSWRSRPREHHLLRSDPRHCEVGPREALWGKDYGERNTGDRRRLDRAWLRQRRAQGFHHLGTDP